jgi:hypothetical protein
MMSTEKLTEENLVNFLAHQEFNAAAISTDKAFYKVEDYLQDDDLDQALSQAVKEREVALVILASHANRVSFGVTMSLSEETGVHPFDPERDGLMVIVTVNRGSDEATVIKQKVKLEDGGVWTMDPVQVTVPIDKLPHDIPGMLLIQELGRSQV